MLLDVVFTHAAADIFKSVSDLKFLKICKALASSAKSSGWLAAWMTAQAGSDINSQLQQLVALNALDWMLIEEAAAHALGVGNATTAKSITKIRPWKVATMPKRPDKEATRTNRISCR